MEGHFPAAREELYHVQMDVKHVQAVQSNHADRLLRLEKRQADDAALKSVWNSPFPSVLSGTPVHGPVHTPSAEVFDDFDDEQSQNLLGSLHLEAEEEPVRRGASRANSVRFDVSAIHGSNWAEGSRSSGEYGPVRPSSGFGSHPMTERSLSHKSDGRHSSAGHSVHSMHSAPSGRTSSLGLDTNFIIGGQDDDSPIDIPEPPPGLFILGTVPSIIRCWLNENFSHSALLYAVVCTGSQKSTLEYSLLKELDLADQVEKNAAGTRYIRLPVYLPEAVVTHPSSRANSPAPQLPTLTAFFEVVGMNQRASSERKKGIRVFLGSDTLRAHNADLLFSQNVMTLYGDDRNKLSVPFVRPEDDSVFKNIATANMTSDRVELKATAAPFLPVEQKTKSEPHPTDSDLTRDLTKISVASQQSQEDPSFPESPEDNVIHSVSLKSMDHRANGKPGSISTDAQSARHSDGTDDSDNHQEDIRIGSQVFSTTTAPELDRRESSGGIWGSWRSGVLANNENDSGRDNSTSSYQRSGRGGRSMKVLKPSKVSQNGRFPPAARTGASYEPPTSRVSGESRRKSQVGLADTNSHGRWDSKRVASEDKSPKEPKVISNVSRSPNPIGGASAFSWMNSGKTKASATTAE